MPTTLDALLILLLFVLPGFLMMRMFVGARAYSEPSEFRFAVTAILFSVIIHAIFGFWTRGIYLSYLEGSTFEDGFLDFYLWFVTVMVVAPLVFGIALAKLTTVAKVDSFLAYLGFSSTNRTPSAWDEVFQSGQGYWVIIEMTDGAKLGGKFSTRSCVSLSPSPRDIYIEEVYQIDANESFLQPMMSTEGAWVDGSQIKSVKFFK